MKATKVSVVVPVFNAENTLDELTKLLCQNLVLFSTNYEIIFVDDRSPDKSWSKIKEISVKNRFVKGVKMAKNYGVDKVITAGVEKTDGDFVFIISCDLQDPVDKMKDMYEKIQIESNLDIICSFYTNKHPESNLSRYLSALYWRFFSFFIKTHYPEEEGLYRLLSRKAIDFYLTHTNNFKHIKILHDTGLEKGYIKMKQRLRTEGKSGYNLIKKLKFAVDYITTYSYVPLIYSSIISFGISVLGFIFSLSFIILKIIGLILIPGWTSIIVIVSFFFSILFLNLSILSLYLSKSIEESKRPNSFFISEEC